MKIENNYIYLTDAEISALVDAIEIDEDGHLHLEHEIGDVTICVTADFVPYFDYDLGMEQRCFDSWYGPLSLTVSAYTKDALLNVPYKDVYLAIDKAISSREWR